MPGVRGPKGAACARARRATGRGWGTGLGDSAGPRGMACGGDGGAGTGAAGEANSQGLEGGWTQGSEKSLLRKGHLRIS